MKHKKKQQNNDYKNKGVRQMTDAELRRALDFSVGDIVRLSAYRETIIGPITDIKLSHGKQFLIYVVLANSKNGVRYIQARSDQIIFLQHGDEQ